MTKDDKEFPYILRRKTLIRQPNYGSPIGILLSNVVREGLILLSYILRRRNYLKDMLLCTSQRFVHVNAPN
jgi:hypothetical protein